MGAHTHNDRRMPEFATDELLAELRAGGTEAGDCPPSRNPDGIPTKMSGSEVPAVISNVLASADRSLLLSIAHSLCGPNSARNRIVFVTPVGDIACRYMWASATLSESSDSLFFIKIRSSDMVFTPRAGAEMDILLDAARHPVRVMCMMAPLRIYDGVDLLCFMPHNSLVQKNGQLKVDAPSVVSGAASDSVVDGEPVCAGEVPVADAVEKMAKATARDFDQVRPSR